MADLAVVVCDPDPARALSVAPFLKHLEDEAFPHAIFVNRIDMLQGQIGDTIAALQSLSKRPLVLRQVPIRHDGRLTGYADVVSGRAYMYSGGESLERVEPQSDSAEGQQAVRDAVAETLADHDDALLEKIIEGLSPSAAEVFERLRADQAHDHIAEVLLGSAEKSSGSSACGRRCAMMCRTPPTPPAGGPRRRGGTVAQAFKIVHAGHMGRLAYARVWRGTLQDGATLNGSRLGGIYHLHDGEPSRVTQAEAGPGGRPRPSRPCDGRHYPDSGGGRVAGLSGRAPASLWHGHRGRERATT